MEWAAEFATVCSSIKQIVSKSIMDFFPIDTAQQLEYNRG
jgi:hypothetical protein